MELIEWAGFLRALQLKFEEIAVAKRGVQNKEIGTRLFISGRTIGHQISFIFFKLDVHSRAKTVQEAVHMDMMLKTISNLK